MIVLTIRYITIAAIPVIPYVINASIVFCLIWFFSSEYDVYANPAEPRYEEATLSVAITDEPRLYFILIRLGFIFNFI